jgi:hypothetical protein
MSTSLGTANTLGSVDSDVISYLPGAGALCVGGHSRNQNTDEISVIALHPSIRVLAAQTMNIPGRPAHFICKQYVT